MLFTKMFLVLLILLMIPTFASGQTCYKVSGLDLLPNSNPYNASFIFTGLTSTSCSSTPSNHGWKRIYSAPYELHLAIPNSLAATMTECYAPFYFGQSGSTPIVPLQLVSGTCDNNSFSLSSTPPACTALNSVSISGPSSTYLYHSHPFTANFSGGQSPFTYTWSIRHHSTSWGWSSWSSFNGSQTTTASSSSCGYDKYQLKVKVTENSCNLNRTSSTKTVTVLNHACPW